MRPLKLTSGQRYFAAGFGLSLCLVALASVFHSSSPRDGLAEKDAACSGIVEPSTGPSAPAATAQGHNAAVSTTSSKVTQASHTEPGIPSLAALPAVPGVTPQLPTSVPTVPVNPTVPSASVAPTSTQETTVQSPIAPVSPVAGMNSGTPRLLPTLPDPPATPSISSAPQAPAIPPIPSALAQPLDYITGSTSPSPTLPAVPLVPGTTAQTTSVRVELPAPIMPEPGSRVRTETPSIPTSGITTTNSRTSPTYTSSTLGTEEYSSHREYPTDRPRAACQCPCPLCRMLNFIRSRCCLPKAKRTEVTSTSWITPERGTFPMPTSLTGTPGTYPGTLVPVVASDMDAPMSRRR